MKQIGLIGVTGYGQVHAELALASHREGQAVPAAAAVINPEEAAPMLDRLRAVGCRIFGGYQEMLSAMGSKLDLVCIPTAIHWHADMTIASLQAGANVLVEKPLAGSTAEADRMAEAMQRTNRKVAVGFQDTYRPSTWWIKDWILRGGVGRLQRLKLHAVWPREFSYYRRNNWAGRLTVDGRPVFDSPLNNALAHYLNLLLFWGGPGRGESAAAEQIEANLYRAQPIESFDTASVRALLQGGVEMLLHVTHSAREQSHPSLVVEGDRGTITWGFEGKIAIHDQDGAPTKEAPDWPEPPSRESMWKAVLSLVDGQDPDYATVGIGRAHCAFIEALHRVSPIQDVHPESIDRSDPKRASIREIERLSLEAFRENRLVSLPVA